MSLPSPELLFLRRSVLFVDRFGIYGTAFFPCYAALARMQTGLIGMRTPKLHAGPPPIGQVPW